eukprot:6583915-Prymnesium_polylepis.1
MVKPVKPAQPLTIECLISDTAKRHGHRHQLPQWKYRHPVWRQDCSRSARVPRGNPCCRLRDCAHKTEEYLRSAGRCE